MCGAATVLSVQIGLPRDLGDPTSADPMDRPWRSGFFKQPVAGPVRVTVDGIAGDGVADPVNHGGPEKAVLGYAAAHYPAWRDELAPAAVPFGGFGENLTLDGLAEATVCAGDVYRLGAVVLEVSQPRQPCWKLGRRWRRRDLPARVIETGRTGWYFRVRTPGELAAGAAVELVGRPFPGLTVAALNDMLYGRRPATSQAAACAALPPAWRDHLRHRLG